MINGIDASWGVVEGEFGLDRPGVVAPTVIYRPLQVSVRTPSPATFHDPTASPAMGVWKSCRRRMHRSHRARRVTSVAGLAIPSPVRSRTIRRIRHRPSSMRRRSRAQSRPEGSPPPPSLNSTSSAGRTWPVSIRLLIGAASEGVSCRSIVLSLWHSPRSSRSACRRRRLLSAAATEPRRRSITPPRAVAAAAVKPLTLRPMHRPAAAAAAQLMPRRLMLRAVAARAA